MRVKDRVRVTAAWSSFYGMRGRVTQVEPHIMIIIEGDVQPIRVGEREIVLDEPDEIPLTGAE